MGGAAKNAEVLGAPLGSHSAHPPSGVAPSGVVTFEVGAGTGGTASSVLPVICCDRYVFTDVSEVFLRQARSRFAAFGFVEYALLNIDADPRFQGFSPHQCDFIIATNVLHATPFMRNTLLNCEQLLSGDVPFDAFSYCESLRFKFGVQCDFATAARRLVERSGVPTLLLIDGAASEEPGPAVAGESHVNCESAASAGGDGGARGAAEVGTRRR